MTEATTSRPGVNADDRFDVEEFAALRQEILNKVDANYRVEVFAVTGTAAVYAWLGTRADDIAIGIWYLPILFPVLAFLRAKKLGHQMDVVGEYLRILETRLRPNEMSGLDGRPLGPNIHGWEGYVHRPHVWKAFQDKASLYFWVSFILLTLVLPFVLRWR
ncbi:MAG TPA: hypothetical protein VEK79_05390 [Thermoanaerobaculia bacterium]|nr:hypothetical protein [Thermoanaerobaculia bacterium]